MEVVGDMRKDVVNCLYEIMQVNKDVIVLSADLGYGLFDKIRSDYPDRFYNTGASEAACSDICVGLALSGKIPVMYSITPFLLYRAFETWRTYVNHEKVKVILLGGGRDEEYENEGWSHHATDDYFFMQHFQNIQSVWPQNNEVAKRTLTEAIEAEQPYYINLRK